MSIIKLSLNKLGSRKFVYLAILIAIVTTAYYVFNSLSLAAVKAKQCSKVADYGQKAVCWEELLKNEVTSRGIDKGFDLFLHLYETYPEFSKTCHDYTHLIGEEAYGEYSSQGEVEVVSETSYCGYGFYHGFIIAMMAEEGSISKSSEFCDYANEKLQAEVPGIALDCYHGIGHGATDFVFSNEGDLSVDQTMINNSLDICEQVGGNENEVSRCVDGVYHALTEVNIENTDLYDKEDPFKLCKTQPEKYKTACYGSLAFLIMEFNNNDFEAAVNEVEGLQNSDYAKTLVRQLSGYQGYRTVDQSDFRASIFVCRNTQPRMKEECFKGFVEGLTDFGKPGKEHEKVIGLCSKDYLLDEERRLCFTHGLDYFSRYFGEDRKKEACDMIEDQYKIYCQ